MISLSNYTPSESMLRAWEHNFSDDIMRKTDNNFDAYLKARQLNVKNVCSVLKTLIGIEDIYTMHQYSLLIQCNVPVKKTVLGNYCVKLSQNNSGAVCTPFVDNVVLLPSGTLSAELNPRQRILDLTRSGMTFEIVSVRNNCVVFQPSASGNSWTNNLNETHYDVLFRNSRFVFRLMYRSLNVFSTNKHSRHYLFPVFGTKKMDTQLVTFPLLNSSLATNPDQLQAVQQIVAGPNPNAPYIVFGPPGTGKTLTIVEAILQVYLQRNGRILVTAPSNSACSTITLRLVEYIEKDARFQSSSEEANNVLLRLISRSRFRKQQRFMDPLELKYSNFPNSRRVNHTRNAKKSISLESYGIIVSTLCTAGIQFQHSGKPFTHVFIDEAASATEVEIILAIAGIKNNACHVILAGDHKQLGPVVKNERARCLGLPRSTFERLLFHKLYEVDSSGNYNRTLQSRLRRSYRAHPEIVGIYNKLYYNNELIPMAPIAQVDQAAKWSELPNGKFPILFQATHGQTESKPNSTSKYNKLEAKMVYWFVTNLLNEGLGDFKVEQKDIGIVTPYLSQRRLLKGLLKSTKNTNVEVGTVESFQGREKLIIIASLVSSFKGTRFLSNPCRINVMISRAQALLILIGNPISLSKNDDFKFIIDQCQAKGNFLKEIKHFNLENMDIIIEKLNLQCNEDEDENGDGDGDEDEDENRTN